MKNEGSISGTTRMLHYETFTPVNDSLVATTRKWPKKHRNQPDISAIRHDRLERPVVLYP
jgi:hypothetical protein